MTVSAPGERIDLTALVAAAIAQDLRLATAESLTAGALVARLVDVPGASATVVGGAACYSLDAKTRVLGVGAELLAREGAVTAEVARQMARGALELYAADLAVSTTGVAGPGPDERGVPAGTVWLGLARRGAEPLAREVHLSGDRAAVRAASVEAALQLLSEHVERPAQESPRRA